MTTENTPDVSASSLPCLFSSNSIQGTQDPPFKVPSHYRKASVALAWNVAGLAVQYGLDRLGFLTLTFADHVLDVKVASRRLNSLASNVLNDRYLAWLRVLERQKSGRIHYHLIVVLPVDIRSGVDFAAFASGDYRSAGPALRAEGLSGGVPLSCIGSVGLNCCLWFPQLRLYRGMWANIQASISMLVCRPIRG